MQINGYGKVQQNRYKKLKRRLTGLIIILITAIITVALVGIFASDSQTFRDRVTVLEENHALREQTEELQSQVEALKQQIENLEGTVAEKDKYIASIPTSSPSPKPTLKPETEEDDDLYVSPRE